MLFGQFNFINSLVQVLTEIILDIFRIESEYILNLGRNPKADYDASEIDAISKGTFDFCILSWSSLVYKLNRNGQT